MKDTILNSVAIVGLFTALLLCTTVRLQSVPQAAATGAMRVVEMDKTVVVAKRPPPEAELVVSTQRQAVKSRRG